MFDEPMIYDFLVTTIRPTELRYVVTIWGAINAAFLQRPHAEAHYRHCAISQDDLPNCAVAFWHIPREGAPELIDHVTR